MKSLQLAMNGKSIDVESVIKNINESYDESEIKKTIDRVKAARKIAEAIERLNEMRLDLFRIELAAVIRAGQIGIKVKGVSEEETKMFVSIGNNPEKYQELHGEVWTISQVVWARRRETKIGEARKRGGDYYKQGVSRSDSHEACYYSIQDAMRTIIETASQNQEPFTTNDLYCALVDSAKQSDPETEIEAYKDGVKEICRNAMLSEKITTIGDRKAPAFVTVRTTAGDYIRVPFRYANIEQIESMIEIREDQIRQDKLALDRLVKIKDDLKAMTNDKKMRVEDILKDRL